MSFTEAEYGIIITLIVGVMLLDKILPFAQVSVARWWPWCLGCNRTVTKLLVCTIFLYQLRKEQDQKRFPKSWWNNLLSINKKNLVLQKTSVLQIKYLRRQNTMIENTYWDMSNRKPCERSTLLNQRLMLLCLPIHPTAVVAMKNFPLFFSWLHFRLKI